MCLTRCDETIAKKFGKGYKVVLKKEGRYFSWDGGRGLEYQLGEWQTDPKDYPIEYPGGTYRTGYHVSLNLGKCREILFKTQNSFRQLVILECRFRKVTASEIVGPVYGTVVVAREIKLVREVE